MSKKKTTISDLIARQMNEKLGDFEFQSGIAPRMQKGANIDPKKAKLHKLPKDLRDSEINFKGFSVPEGYSGGAYELPYNGDIIEIPSEPGSVNIIGAKQATNRIWAHEYRHQEDADRGSEQANRVLDLVTSQNQRDIDASTKMLSDMEFRNLRKQYARSSDREGLKKEFERVKAIYSSNDKNAIKNHIKKRFKGDIEVVLRRKEVTPSPIFKRFMGIEPTRQEKKSAKRMDKIIAKQQKKMKKSLLDAQKRGRKDASLLPDGF